MAFNKTLLVMKTASLWRKKLKNNKFTKTTFFTHPHGCVVNTRIYLSPLHRFNPTTCMALGFPLHKFSTTYLNYFVLYRYLLTTCTSLGMRNKKFWIRPQRSQSSPYLQLL